MKPHAMQLAALLSGQAAMPEASFDGDWEAIVCLAARLDVAPALHARLKDSGARLPAAATEQLRESYLASAARNMRLMHERDRVLAALKAAKVCVVPVKGASLAEELYGDAALRPMGDIDLWVRRLDVGAARAAMEPLGYCAVAKADRPPALQDALMGETQMVGPGATLVELHWSIFSGEWLRHTARVDQDTIWERTLPAGDEAVRRLAAEDAVVHLCVHLAVNHQMSGIGLRTLVDLDHARGKWAIDWTVVAQRARKWSVSCAVWLVLDALAELFGDPERELPMAELAPSPGAPADAPPIRVSAHDRGGPGAQRRPPALPVLAPAGGPATGRHRPGIPRAVSRPVVAHAALWGPGRPVVDAVAAAPSAPLEHRANRRSVIGTSDQE